MFFLVTSNYICILFYYLELHFIESTLDLWKDNLPGECLEYYLILNGDYYGVTYYVLGDLGD